MSSLRDYIRRTSGIRSVLSQGEPTPASSAPQAPRSAAATEEQLRAGTVLSQGSPPAPLSPASVTRLVPSSVPRETLPPGHRADVVPVGKALDWQITRAISKILNPDGKT